MAEDHDDTPNRRLLYAARHDDVEMMREIFDKEVYDINYQDGIGNTALHYAASEGSLDALNELLEQDGCDVDFTNIHGATPLHLAVKIEQPQLRALITDSLLDAGANESIKDKAGQVALYYVPEDDTETRNAFRRNQALKSILKDDIASDDEDSDDDGEDSESDE